MAQNLYRLICLVNDISGDVLRQYLSYFWQNAGYTSLNDLLTKEIHLLYHCLYPRHLCCCGHQDKFSRPSLTKTQWDILYEPYPPRHLYRGQHPCQFCVKSNLKLEDLDVTIACLVILKVLKPLQHLELAIEKIRDIRNFLCHLPSTSVDDATFEQKWSDTTRNTLLLAKEVSANYHDDIKNDVDGLKTKSLDARECKRLIKVLTTFREHDKLLQGLVEDVQTVQTQVQNVHSDVKTQIQNVHSDVQAQIQNVHGDVQTQIQNVHSDVQTQIQDVHSDVQTQIQNVHSDVQTQIQNVQDDVQSVKCKLTLEASKDTYMPLEIDRRIVILETHKKTVYVPNSKAEKESYERLTNDHWVTLSGRGGCGKTTLAKQLMVRFCNQHEESDRTPKYSPVIIQKPTDFDLIQGKDYLLIFVDDPFGKTNTDNVLLQEWEKHFEALSSFSKDGNVRVIIGCRSSIMKDCESKIRNWSSFQDMKTVDISENYQLTSNEKLEMLKAYCSKYNVEICDKENGEFLSNNYSCKNSDGKTQSSAIPKTRKSQISVELLTQISESDPLIGFPQSCCLFFSVESLFNQGIGFFKHANESLIKEISCLRKEAPMQFFILVLMLLNKGKINTKYIREKKVSELGKLMDEKYKLKDIKDCVYHDMTSAYIEKVDNDSTIYQFTHETILEAVLLIFSENDPKIFLQFCSCQIVQQFARPFSYQPQPGEICAKLPVKYHKQLAQRLVNDATSLFSIVSNRSTSDESFVQDLLDEVEKNVSSYELYCIFGNFNDYDARPQDRGLSNFLAYAIDANSYYVVRAVCKRYTNYRDIYSEEVRSAKQYPSKPRYLVKSALNATKSLFKRKPNKDTLESCIVQQTTPIPTLSVESFLHALNYMLTKGKVDDVEGLLRSSGLDLAYVHNSGKCCSFDDKKTFICKIRKTKPTNTWTTHIYCNGVFSPVCYAAGKEMKDLLLLFLDRINNDDLRILSRLLVYSCFVYDWFDVLEKILLKCRDVFHPHNIGSETFSLCLEIGTKNKTFIFFFLKHGYDINLTDITINCCIKDWVDVFEKVLENNMKTVLQSHSPSSLILRAAGHRSKNMVLCLLKFDIDITETDRFGYHLLHYICEHDWVDVITKLVETNQNALKIYPPTILIFCAAKYKSKEMVLYLLQYITDLTVTDEHGNNLCHYWSENGWDDLVLMIAK